MRPTSRSPGVEQRLRGCGFTAHTASGIAVYTGSGIDCAGPNGANLPASANVYAIDAPHHLVLTSASPQAISAALANRASHSSNPVLQNLLGALLPASAIGVSVGPGWCSLLSQATVLAGHGAGQQTIARAARLYLPAAPYRGFGFGYTYAASGVSGRLAFTYADGQSAQQDLTAREHTLRTGVSLVTGNPYTRAVTVRSGQVGGSTAILQVGPGASGHLQLGAMLSQLDLGFARCG